MISVIMPVLNVGEYLPDMLESILDQSYGDFEVILINDRSIDNTEEVIEDFLKRDSRLRLLKGPGEGVSEARNRGILAAKGDYFLFLDGDDTIEKEMFKTLTGLLQGENEENGKNGNIIFSSCGYLKEKEGEPAPFNYVYGPGEVDAAAFLNERLFIRDTASYQGYVWNKLFRGDIIREHNIFFDKDIFYNEDRLFITKYIDAALRHVKNPVIRETNEALYRYRIREDSAMGREKERFLSEREITELTAYYRIMARLSQMNGDFKKAEKEAKNDMCGAVLRKFYRMTDNADKRRYKNSMMRRFAGDFPYFSYKARDYQERVLKVKLFIYYLTGIAFGSRGE